MSDAMARVSRELDWTAQSSWAEKRTLIRASIDVVARVRPRPWVRVSAKVVDLSRAGCRVRGVELYEGDQTIVSLPGLEPLTATVCWAQGEEAGLAFAQHLHAAVFEHFRATHG